ncbi:MULTISPECIES: winged helix-turn-helix transcriptional regulator [Streptomyces]|uniref:winged helix-turn-helix transcriptional regulator n=1 Tax=Streptomyces TaxID=1883 RepID=UPI000241AECE|nr:MULTISPECIES: helix-turn-helix domain-containing protein [Streptomyces]EHM27706.1 putative transcriptional regulator [Streptomyces sp. W007]MCX4488944.1 helix-turn-helix transcriptional regulator [Streptomyces anulatus]MCX4520852.1 helix-turn-helix transcriptional regulator [Streptomyces anulatus]MCX4603722.1 helix-turn-helix transcriptional regulator [Streptomyces anulatus]WSI80014.1 helix-turn-helix transcriptional regulator [Streptomyces anulatus]
MRIVRRPGAFVCGIDAAMDVIGGKWKVLILWVLNERTCRFGELRRAVTGVTEKVLSSHLKELEDDGIVHREVYAEVPPRVEYSLTPLGLSLNAALEPLGLWGREHIYRGAEEAGVGVDAGVGLDTGVGAGADCEAEPQVVAGLGCG